MFGYLTQSIISWTGNSDNLSQDDTRQNSSIFESIADTVTFKKIYTAVVPELFNLVPQTLNVLGQNLEKRSPQDQAKYLSAFLKRLDIDKWADTIQTWLSISNKVNAFEKEFITQNFDQKIRSFIEKIDFADFKDFLQQTASDVNALSENVNNVLWDYPAKMVLLCSIIPLAGNTICLISKNALKHFNAVPPDALADIVISLIKELDIQVIARFLNESCELIRKLHTGSALIGEPGSDAFSQQVNRIFNTLTTNLDEKTVFKAKQAIQKIKNIFFEAYFNSITRDENQFANEIHLWFDKQNQKTKNLRQISEALDESPDDFISNTIGKQIKEIDITESTEVINIFLQLIERLNELQPETIQTVVLQWLNQLDIDSMETIVNELSPDIMKAMAPIIQNLAPPIINAFCESMEDNEQFTLAINRLKDRIIE